jgi:hypothetical protein
MDHLGAPRVRSLCRGERREESGDTNRDDELRLVVCTRWDSLGPCSSEEKRSWLQAPIVGGDNGPPTRALNRFAAAEECGLIASALHVASST